MLLIKLSTVFILLALGLQHIIQPKIAKTKKLPFQ